MQQCKTDVKNRIQEYLLEAIILNSVFFPTKIKYQHNNRAMQLLRY